ncbi:MAG: hypothetical protein ACR2LL_10390 [Nitrosopumilus sp.]
MKKDRYIIFLFLICLVITVFIHVHIFPQLSEWFGNSFKTYDGMVVPYGANAEGLAISVLVTFVSLLPVFFLILVLVHFFTRHRGNLLDYVWTFPMKKISNCVENIQQKKISFFVMSTIISTMTVLVAVHTTTENLLSSFSDLIGFFDLAGVYKNIPKSYDLSGVASEALIGQFGIFAFLLFGVGPVWLLLIRWAKKEEIKNHPGPRMLLSYLYGLATILIFVQIGFFVSDQPPPEDKIPPCNSDRPSQSILEFTLYGKTAICQSVNFAVIIVTSILTSLFAYFVVTRVLHHA